MKLQVALDVTSKGEALRICKKVYKYVDIIELGTILIKKEGLGIIPKFKKFRKPILTDLKTMDTGFLEAETAFKAGADMMVVSGVVDNSTIIGAVKAGKKYKKKVMVDMNAVENPVKRAKQLLKLGVDYIELHTGIDLQRQGKSPLNDLIKLSKAIPNRKIAVAGGIGLRDIDKVVKYKPEIVVVGGAITKSKHPKKIAEVLKEKIK